MSNDTCRRHQGVEEGALWCKLCWRYKNFRSRCAAFEPGGARLHVKRGKLTWHRYTPKAVGDAGE